MKGSPARVDPAGHGRGAVEPAALRLRRGVQGGHPVRRPATPAGRRSPRARSRAWRAPATTRRPRRPSPTACTRRSSRPIPETAEIHVLRYCVVHDCGPLINPMIVEGQVHGGVAQGVGGALYERMVYDENGQLLNASFMDFLMPYASEVPHIEIDHLETPSPLNPLGIKGAGEAGVIPSAAVFAAADRGRRGLPDRPDADLAERAVRPAPPARRRGDPGAAPPRREHDSEGHRFGHPERAARAGLGRAQRPRRAGAHHPGLPAARGGRPGRLPDDARRRGRVDQGHLPGRRRADRPGAAGRVHACAPPAPAPRARCRPTCGSPSPTTAAARPGWTTTPTRSSAA